MSHNILRIVAAAFFYVGIASVSAETTSSTLSHPPTAGLRIQIDEQGKRVESAVPVDRQTAPGSVAEPATANTHGVAPANSRVPQVLSVSPGAAKVVRLNGLFRAGSRATVAPDGSLTGDCHVAGSSMGDTK